MHALSSVSSTLCPRSSDMTRRTSCPAQRGPRSVGDDSEAQAGRRLWAWAIPVAVACAFCLVWAVPSLVRIFLGRWVHELGHAATAWMCGYLAFPGPWLTPTASQQSLIFELLVL